VAANFAEIFEVELQCWCYGLTNIEDRVERRALNEVVKDFAPVFKEAIENLYAFDPIETTRRLLTAARCPELEKEMTFYLLSLLPFPTELNGEQAKILNEIVLKVERLFGGAIQRLQRKWNSSSPARVSAPRKARAHSETSFENLSFPSSLLDIKKL